MAYNGYDRSNTHINSDKVFQRFAHFQPFDVQVTSVQKIINP